jgi:urea transport system permease protein
VKTRPNILVLLVLLIGSAFTSIVSAQVSATSEGLAAELNESEKLNELLVKLTEVKLNKAVPVLHAIEELGGETMLPLFQTMLKGDLYYLKQNKSLVAKDDEVFTDVFSGIRIENLSRSETKKVKVNNKLRRVLKESISRIQLSSPKSSVREQAIISLLSELDSSIIQTLNERRELEQDEDVLDIMDVAFAMFTLQTSDTDSEKLEAIHFLGGRLENDARNLLIQVNENEENIKLKAATSKAIKTIEQRVENFQFVDKVFFGLSLGSVLLLAAIGLAITFGVMGVINMAHGEMIMLGAYTTYVVQMFIPVDYSIWVAIPAAFVVSGLVGILIERGVIRHLHGRPLETLLATFGISLILQQLVRTIFSPLNRQVESPSWMSGSLDINPVLSLTLNRLYILAFALLVFGLLMLVLNKTSLGLNVRAVAQNRNMAKAMGIRTDRVDAMTFGLGSGIAGMAGVALSQLTNVGPNLGQAYIIDSFMVVVFGGVGNLWGTLVAGFSLGIANKFIEPITGAVLASILVLVFIILFIQKRPKGLFPQKGRAAE